VKDHDRTTASTSSSRRRFRRSRRSIYILPSIFTVGNIFAGFFAVIATLNGHYGKAAVAIGIAVVLDGLDGRIARLVGATSEFGLQLDSLADVISFGIAPAVLIYSWGFTGLGNFARLSAFFFLICGAMRLARFNVQVQDLKHFAGLPIPAGAGFLAATVHLFKAPPESDFFKFSLVAATCFIGLLMISTLRYPSPKQLPLTRGKSHLTVLLLALVVAGVIWYSEEVLMLLASAYVLSGLILRVFQMVRYRMRHSGELKTTRAESK
jgi:CDP-diacylglycerol---serine O-phosphatidyltransferase